MSVVEGAEAVGGAMAVLRHGVWDEYGRTTLMAAALLGEVEVVRYVLLVVRQQGGPVEGVVNQRDETGATALLLACMDGTEAVVSALLQAGADPWLCDHEGYSALHAAAGFNHLCAARLLMDQPSSPSQLRALVNRRAAVWGETPLWLAVEQAHADMVALLLSRGAGEEGAQEALEVARQHEGMQAVVKMLLAAAISSSSKQPSGGKLSEVRGEEAAMAEEWGGEEGLTMIMVGVAVGQEEEEGEAKGLEGEGRVQLFMEACALGLLDEVRGMAASSGGGLVRARDAERAGMTGLMRAAEAGHTQVRGRRPSSDRQAGREGGRAKRLTESGPVCRVCVCEAGGASAAGAGGRGGGRGRPRDQRPVAGVHGGAGRRGGAAVRPGRGQRGPEGRRWGHSAHGEEEQEHTTSLLGLCLPDDGRGVHVVHLARWRRAVAVERCCRCCWTGGLTCRP